MFVKKKLCNWQIDASMAFTFMYVFINIMQSSFMTLFIYSNIFLDCLQYAPMYFDTVTDASIIRHHTDCQLGFVYAPGSIWCFALRVIYCFYEMHMLFKYFCDFYKRWNILHTEEGTGHYNLEKKERSNSSDRCQPYAKPEKYLCMYLH